MKELTKFEIRKIIKRKSSIMAIVMFFLVCIINIVFSVSTESYGSDLTGDLKKGILAISQKREEVNNLKGNLTEKRISEVINIYNNLSKNSKNMSDFDGLSEEDYYTHWQKYKDIDSLIDRSYGESLLLGVDASKNLKLEDGSTFYSNREKQILNYIEHESLYEYTNEEKDKIIQITNDMETPLYYDYTDGWFKLIWDMNLLLLVLIICISICISPVFSSECEEHMDSIILSTKYGKNKLILSKFKASFIFTSIFYFVSVVFMAFIRLFIYGFEGWNCKIQVVSTYWHSMYNINFLQAFLLSVVLGYIACLVTVSIAIFISSKLKNSFAVIVSTLGILFIPKVISTINVSKFIDYIIDLFPINISNVNNILGYYKFYNIFGNLVIQPWIMMIVSIILIIALLFSTYKIFRKHEVA